MKRPWPARQPLTFLLLVCALVTVGTTVGCGGSYEDPLAPFNDSLGKYLQPLKGGADVEVYTQYGGKPQGYIKGRLILVEDKAISNWNTHLPRSLRAAAPGDVGTVVVIKQSWDKVGTYSGGEAAFQDLWKISVVDLARGKVVGRALLRGDHPPAVANISAGENRGPPPWEELLTYLKKLPRR